MTPVTIHIGDVLDGLAKIPDGAVHCCVTSPPYWGLRDYGVDGQIGLEKTPEEFIGRMVEVFREVRRVLREDGTLWLNLGDSYFGGDGRNRNGMPESGVGAGKSKPGAGGDLGIRNIGTRPTRLEGYKPKSLCMMPWRVALALQADGWWLRSVICWAKKSPMPESVTDRPTSSWEPIFLLAKSERYFYDAEAVKEASEQPGRVRSDPVGGVSWEERNQHDKGGVVSGATTRNQRNVWHLGPEPYKEAHFATFPTEIPRRAIKAGTSEKGCCAACGAPWGRVVEKSGGTIGKGDWRQGAKLDRGMCGVGTMPSETNPGVNFDTYRVRTIGWQPGCTCGAEVVPCLVLDPFLGSGTTVAVAREMGRHGVGCELNPQYAALARERIGKAERPSTFRSEKAIDSPMFTEAQP